MHVLVTSKYKKDRIKNNREKVETSFSRSPKSNKLLIPSDLYRLANLQTMIIYMLQLILTYHKKMSELIKTQIAIDVRHTQQNMWLFINFVVSHSNQCKHS